MKYALFVLSASAIQNAETANELKGAAALLTLTIVIYLFINKSKKAHG